MSGLRILFVGYLPPFSGGAGTANARIVEALSARGHQIHAIAPITPSDEEQGDWFLRKNPGIQVHRFLVPSYMSILLTPKPAAMLVQEQQFAQWTREQLQSSPPDLVLLGGEVAHPALAVCREFSIPTSLIVHGSALWRMRRKIGERPELEELHSLYRQVGQRIAVADHLRDQLHSLGYSPSHVVKNTIDTDCFQPQSPEPQLLAELSIHPDDFVIAHFSNLMPVKRPLDFVEAAALALRQSPQLLFLLSHNSEHSEALEARCRSLGIAHRFRFLPWIQSDQMPRYYSLCHAVAMPSESEARSMVCLETIASGRLLIASNIPAARELIEHNRTGLLHPMGDIEALAQCFCQAAADPARSQHLGLEARAALLAEQSLDYGASLESVLRQLLNPQ